MTAPTRLGMLTPSSNTALEPVTTAMLRACRRFGAFLPLPGDRDLADRRRAGAIRRGADPGSSGLLADAKVDVIAWNGTSSGWLGFEADGACASDHGRDRHPGHHLDAGAERDPGRTGVKRFGLVTPYLDAVQQRIIANYAALGIECDAERHLNIQAISLSPKSPATLTEMIRAVAAAEAGRIGIICTNLRAAPLVAALEAGDRHPDLRHDRHGGVEEPEAGRGRSGRRVGWGRLLSGRESPSGNRRIFDMGHDPTGSG